MVLNMEIKPSGGCRYGGHKGQNSQVQFRKFRSYFFHTLEARQAPCSNLNSVVGEYCHLAVLGNTYTFCSADFG